MSDTRLLLLQEATNCLDASPSSTSNTDDVLDGISDTLAELVEIYRLHKASKKYWKKRYEAWTVQHMLINGLNNGLLKGAMLPYTAVNTDEAQDECEFAEMIDDGAAVAEALQELNSRLDERSKALEILALREPAAQNLLEERKRAEAEPDHAIGANKTQSTGREEKKALRLQLQREEEALRQEALRLENDDMKATKEQYYDVSQRCKQVSHYTLLRKIAFEEAAESLETFLQQISSAAAGEGGVNDDDDGDLCDKEIGAERDVTYNTFFTCRAAAYLKSVEEETKKHIEIEAAYTTTLQNEMTASRRLSPLSCFYIDLNECEICPVSEAMSEPGNAAVADTANSAVSKKTTVCGIEVDEEAAPKSQHLATKQYMCFCVVGNVGSGDGLVLSNNSKDLTDESNNKRIDKRLILWPTIGHSSKSLDTNNDTAVIKNSMADALGLCNAAEVWLYRGSDFDSVAKFMVCEMQRRMVGVRALDEIDEQVLNNWRDEIYEAVKLGNTCDSGMLHNPLKNTEQYRVARKKLHRKASFDAIPNEKELHTDLPFKDEDLILCRLLSSSLILQQ